MARDLCRNIFPISLQKSKVASPDMKLGKNDVIAHKARSLIVKSHAFSFIRKLGSEVDRKVLAVCGCLRGNCEQVLESNSRLFSAACRSASITLDMSSCCFCFYPPMTFTQTVEWEYFPYKNCGQPRILVVEMTASCH